MHEAPNPRRLAGSRPSHLQALTHVTRSPLALVYQVSCALRRLSTRADAHPIDQPRNGLRGLAEACPRGRWGVHETQGLGHCLTYALQPPTF